MRSAVARRRVETCDAAALKIVAAASDGMSVAIWTHRDRTALGLSAQGKKDVVFADAHDAQGGGLSPGHAHAGAKGRGLDQLRATHASLGAVLVDEEGRLVDANPTALGLLGLGIGDVGSRVGVRLAQIAVCDVFGPKNGVVPREAERDAHLGARCLPMGVAGAATTLYLLWDKHALTKVATPPR